MKKKYIQPKITLEELNSIMDFANGLDTSLAGDNIGVNAWDYWD